MLKSHMDSIEQALIEISKIPANSGHSLHKGTPREAFIKKFLLNHLPSNVAIGSGEIIDAHSKPGGKRNQYDIVIYKRSFPKLDFGGEISGFLIESVIATIEVKSLLTKEEFKKSVNAAYNAKSLTSNIIYGFHVGHIPPKVLNYIVAYKGPANLKTVYGWIDPIYTSHGIKQTSLPLDDKKRINTAADAIDAVFILNKGFMYYDNSPIGFANLNYRKMSPNAKWIYSDTKLGSLFLFFLMIQRATDNIEGRWLNANPYLSSFKINNMVLGH
jgi:hypothetical protein